MKDITDMTREELGRYKATLIDQYKELNRQIIPILDELAKIWEQEENLSLSREVEPVKRYINVD